MNRSAEDIERDVEQARHEVDRTAEALRDKISPGQLMDEVMRSFKGGAGSEMLGNLAGQVKDNPLPLAMIGAGMAWLMMGGRQGQGSVPTSYTPPLGAHGTVGETNRSFADAEGLTDSAKQAAHGAMNKVASAAQTLGDGASSIGSGIADKARAAAHEATGAAHGIKHGVQNLAQAEPLVIGALGLAVGAALGAALPSTRLEDEKLGPIKGKVLDEGKARLHQAQDAVTSTVESVKEEVRRQAEATDDGRSLGDKAADVVRTGIDTMQQEAQSRAH